MKPLNDTPKHHRLYKLGIIMMAVGTIPAAYRGWSLVVMLMLFIIAVAVYIEKEVWGWQIRGQ